MSALIDGGANTKKIIRYSQLQVSSSMLDIPITLFWGQRRIAPNCIWYNNFQSHKIEAGKGGGKATGYTYSAAVILALGEGVMSAPVNVWGPSSTTTTTTLAALGFSFTSGTASQTPPSYVTTNYPSQALSYMDTAYVLSSNLNLGESASVPDYGFEIRRLMSFTDTLTAAGWTNPTTHANTAGTDVSLADVIPDFLTNTIYGMGLSAADIEDTTYFREYQDAQGLYFSPLLTSQEKATEILDRWATLANTWIFWDGTQIRFVPLGDSAISGNSATYTPDLAVAYNLGLGDFIAGKNEAPVTVERKDPADCYNRTVLEICDRTRGYIASPVEYKDQQLVATYGLRDDSSTQAGDVCNPAVGAICAQLIGKRAAYIRNTYKFKTSYRHILLLPGSIVTLTEPNIGLSNFPVRIRSVDEDDKGVLSFVAEELPAGIGTYFSVNTPPATVATTVDTNVDPGPVNTPAVCEPASTFSQGQSVALIAASGGANWGGAYVWLSLDGVDYSQIGTITAPALQGTLTAALAAYSGANPDTADTLSIDATESQGVYPAVSEANAQNATSLCWISPQPASSGGEEALSSAGEFLAFGAVSATGTYTANLAYLYRGLYGASGIAHSTGDQFTLFDITGNLGSTLKYPLPPNYIGTTLYLKFQSFNVFGNAAEDLSTVTTYTYTPKGATYGSGTNGVPSEPTGFSAIVQSSQAILSWNANPPADNVTSYAVYRANGTGQTFASAALVWAGDALTFTDSSVAINTGYTYFLVAINAVGDSLPSAGLSETTGIATNGQVLQIGGESGPGFSEIDIDFNAQVLACTILEITVGNVVLGTAGASLLMQVRSEGSTVTNALYNWQYVQAASGASPAGGGAAGDTAIHLANQLSTASGTDEAFGTVTMQIVPNVYPKFISDFVGTYNPSGNKASGWSGTAEFGSTSQPVTGLAFKASEGGIDSLFAAIRGYQI